MKGSGKYLAQLSVFTLAIIILHVSVYYVFPDLEKSDFSQIIYIVFFISTFGSYLMVRSVRKLNPDDFVRLAILTIIVRIIFFAIMSAIIILLDREGHVANMVLFSTLYLLFTIFDIIMEIRNHKT